MYSFVELLRALAAMLITNSHFDGVYPWNISWGGCPGVALFFLISGFVLVKSVQKENFFPWWLKKVIRLYIPLSIVNLVTVLIGYRTPSIKLFLFPININLWYVPAITILYILYYFILRKLSGGVQDTRYCAGSGSLYCNLYSQVQKCILCRARSRIQTLVWVYRHDDRKPDF